MADYEKLGAFYLGKPLEEDGETLGPQPFLYDSKDLTTHGVILGMTGSGKTGLAVTLLEEAAIDGIPIIAIDPKGDLPNLLLTFPGLSAGEFRPWIDEADAARKGRTPDEHAKAMADLWRKGLAEWDQQPERIQRFEDSCERVIYTPGSRAGRPVSALGSFEPPAEGADADARRERVMAAASGLLGLLGIDADPIRSREHILLSNLLERAWSEGRSLDLPTLIQQIQQPPIERIGVLDLDSFFPPGDRFELAMTLNNLLASPGFEAWTEGAPLDIQKMLYGTNGKPRVSIFSIAHLSDPERMFFVTLLLNEVVSWMRAQPGSRGLRALIYMDEVFGYLPPTANPPSKLPMLTLLKQARAFGVGLVLATQNPVDLDYKALSNAGTWFLGRLQTERDKARVIDGLEGAAAGPGFDRAKLERTISGLESRTFLMNNVHEDGPVLFRTRWALSYLAGPITREQIRALALEAGDPGPETVRAAAPSAAPAAARSVARAAEPTREAKRPVLPAGIEEGFLPLTRRPAGGDALVYRPCLAARVSLHYANARAKVDRWEHVVFLAELDDEDERNPWVDSGEFGQALPELDDEPNEGARFADLPSAATRAKTFARWQKMLKTHVYRERAMHVWKSSDPKLLGLPGESEDAFRGRVREALREERDLAVEKLRKKYNPKLERLKDRIETAEGRVELEEQQYKDSKMQSVVSLGTTVLGALFGRKVASTGNVGRAGSAVRGMSRAARQKGDIGRAEARVEQLQEELEELEARFQEDVAEFEEAIDPADVEVETVRVAARKSDLDVERMLVLWTPWRVDSAGIAEPAFEAAGKA